RPPRAASRLRYTTLFRSEPAVQFVHLLRIGQQVEESHPRTFLQQAIERVDVHVSRHTDEGIHRTGNRQKGLRTPALANVYPYPVDRKSTRLNSSHVRISY